MSPWERMDDGIITEGDVYIAAFLLLFSFVYLAFVDKDEAKQILSIAIIIPLLPLILVLWAWNSIRDSNPAGLSRAETKELDDLRRRRLHRHFAERQQDS